MLTLFEVEIPGRPMVKKNGQKVVSKGGYHNTKIVIYSEGWLNWESCSFPHISNAKKKFSNFPIQGPLEVHYEFHLKNRQAEPDTSNLIEGPQDTLKKYGVIVDDKFIYSLKAKKFIDGTEKTVIKIYSLGDSEIKDLLPNEPAKPI